MYVKPPDGCYFARTLLNENNSHAYATRHADEHRTCRYIKVHRTNTMYIGRYRARYCGIIIKRERARPRAPW